MSNPHLYFIALVPDSPLREQVRLLKEEMRDSYGPKHALKSPAHVTLQMPFKQDAAEEPALFDTLEATAAKHRAFKMAVAGFGAFEPRVIYLKVSPHEPIRRVHADLISALRKRLGFAETELSGKIHPHMTVATRDLDEATFRRAWPAYEGRRFEEEFEAEGIWLLRHHGKGWDLHKHFPFKNLLSP